MTESRPAWIVTAVAGSVALLQQGSITIIRATSWLFARSDSATTNVSGGLIADAAVGAAWCLLCIAAMVGCWNASRLGRTRIAWLCAGVAVAGVVWTVLSVALGDTLTFNESL